MEQNKRIQGGIIRIDSKCFPIHMGVNTVGRSKTAVVNIKHLNVSQNQALLVLVDARQHYLADMNSSNGTYLGTTKLVPFKLYELINEAEVKFGDVAATYLKVSGANSNVSLENQTLEMTQNMTQNFYAANTQIMEGDESVINHSNNSDNPSGSQSYLFDDIHEMATQEARFNIFINKIQSTEGPNSKKENGSHNMSKNAKINMHDAPTQVVQFDNISNTENIHDAPTQVVHMDNISNTENIHDAPTQIVHFDNISNTENIHDAPTQIVHFDNISNTESIHDAPTQVVHFDNISNTESIHDAPTQVVHFDNISNTENIHDAITQVVHYDDASNNTEINIHEAPTQVVQYPEKKSVCPKQSNKIQHLHSNSSKSGSQESCDTIIINLSDSSKLETKVTEKSSLITSPGPSVSQLNISNDDDSFLNNSKNVSCIQQYSEKNTVCPKQSNKIQHLHSNSSKSGSQESCDTIIINLSDSSKLETKVTEKSSLITSPGPSVSQLNISKDDDSFLTNSKNVSFIQRTEIEETIIDGNSNDSIDFLSMQVPAAFDEMDNKENVDSLNNENSQPESVHPKNGSLAVDSDLDSNKRSSQDSTQSSIIGHMRKIRKISSSTELEDSDNDIETTLDKIGVKKYEVNQHKNKSVDCESDQESNKRSSQNSTQSSKIGFVRKQIRKRPSSTDLEDSDSDAETTQDIIVKKPLKKLPSDSDSESESLKNVDSPNKMIDLKDVLRTEDDLHKVPVKISETDGAKKSSQDKNNQHLDVTQSSDSDTDCEEHLDEFKRKASQEDSTLNNGKNSQSNCFNNIEDKSKPSSSKMNTLDTSVQKNNKEDKLNDSDYIPATQDAFADAFSYRSEAGKSSSTEDFRLGLTQLMEDSMNDGSLKPLEQNDHINNENNSGITISQQDKKVADVDMFIEPINPVNLAHVTVEEDVYVMPTQQMEETMNVHSKPTSSDREIYDIATQKLPENTNSKETENDDIYLLATQPINIDSQFKVPKSFTFKKKQTTILEKSLNTLLGDDDKDDDIFNAATQKISEPVDVHEPSDGIKETDDLYYAPTQKMTETCEVQKPQSDNIEETEDLYDVPTQAIVATSDEVYLQPTQYIEPSTKDVELPSKSMQADHKQVGVNPLRPQNSVNTDLPNVALFDEPTQPIISDTVDLKTREESSSTKSDEISKVVVEVPALRRSRRKSSSPLPELSEGKNLKEFKKHTTGCRISPIVENADEDKDTVETLSQIERFVKQPFIKTYEKTRTRGLAEATKNVNIRSETPESEPTTSTKKRQYTSALKQCELVTDVNETSTKKSKTVSSHSYSFESTSETGDEGEENTNCKGQGIVKNSADLSLALLESKNTKSRKKITDPVLQDLKVVVTSHRRSMGIAETSVVSSNKTRRTTIATTSTRSKRKLEEVSKKNIDSESSDVEVPNKKSSRTRSKAASDNKTEDITESRRQGRNNRKTKTDESSSTSKSLTIKSSEENETATSDDNFEVTCDSKKSRKGTSSKMSKTEETNVSAQCSEKKIDEPPKYEKRTKRQTTDVIVDDDVSVTKTPSKRGRVLLKTNDDENLDRGSSSGTNISTDTVSTPKKQKKPSVEGLLNSAERAKRKLKPKVVFTMLDNPQLESLIRQLGGSIVDTVNACTVLVTEHVKRSQKLLSAVGQGKPVCSPQWIKESKKSGEFLDPWNFILVDKEAEKKWNFSLKDSISRATNTKLLSDYTFHIMVVNGADVLKGAIEACGGKCVSKVTGRNPDGTFVVIASPEQKNKYTKLIKQNPSIKVVEPEAIFDGVLRQELRLSNHLLQ